MENIEEPKPKRPKYNSYEDQHYEDIGLIKVFWENIVKNKMEKEGFTKQRAEKFANDVLILKRNTVYPGYDGSEFTKFILIKYGSKLNFITFHDIPEVLNNDEADYHDYMRAVLNKY